MQKLSIYLKNPRRAINGLILSTAKFWPDKLYISTLYKLHFRRRLNWENPISFCEKLNWLKMNNRNPQYSIMADKFAVKQYVTNIIGSEFVVENYLVADNWDKIDFDKLPEQFVIKCTHDSGGAFVCRNKSTFDFNHVRYVVEKNLKTNYFYHLREWPYKNIVPRIIVDKYLDDHTGEELRDYKWWCFNGEPKYMYCTIKGKNIYENFYDMDFKPVNICHGYPRHKPEFEKPSQFALMKNLAMKLSQGIPFVRVDFFQVEEHVYFGEFTFYDWGGIRPFRDFEVDIRLGQLIDITQKSIS